MTGMNNAETVTINIDLCPYAMVREGEFWVIKDCAGSILSELEKPERDCWTAHYGDFVGDKFCSITYNAEDEQCEFRHPDSDAVIEWIGEHFNAIESIGYECLQKLQ